MSRLICSVIVCSLAASGVMAAAPTSFADDFQTVTTYNHQTYVDACAGTHPDNAGGLGLPDWSIQAALDGSTFYERAVRGGGKISVSNWAFDNTFIQGLIRIEALFVGWSGGILSCAGEPPIGRSDTVFTHDNLCIYGGYEFNRFQITGKNLSDIDNGAQFGPDLQPGIAGVDDDGNGLTDDDPNCTLGADGQPGVAGVDDDGNGKTDDPGDTHASLECHGDDSETLSGLPAPEYLGLGPDGCAGNCGIDDDGNGLTDISDVPGVFGLDDDRDGVTDEALEMQVDQAELGAPGSDDSDDLPGDYVLVVMMRANIPNTGFMGLIVQPHNADAQFSIQDVTFLNLHNLEGVDEIGPGFYQEDTRYNYAFCATGSVYGAQLWVENDAANPAETIGPIVDTNHLDKGADREVALTPSVLNNGIYDVMQNVTYTTNSTFGDMFQIVEGDIVPIVAQDRDKDGDVDGVDFAVFASCFNKAGNLPRTLGCGPDDAAAFDQDGDNDVDGVDFATFASCFNKAGNPPRRAGCIPDVSGTPTVPANNECANATALGEETIIDVMTTNATQTFDPPDNCASGNPDLGGDLWYVYTPTCTGSATISTDGTSSLPLPVMEDSAMAIFTDCPGTGSLITCNETGGHETITIPVTSGVPVTIAVMGSDASFSSKGKFELSITCTP